MVGWCRTGHADFTVTELFRTPLDGPEYEFGGMTSGGIVYGYTTGYGSRAEVESFRGFTVDADAGFRWFDVPSASTPFAPVSMNDAGQSVVRPYRSQATFGETYHSPDLAASYFIDRDGSTHPLNDPSFGGGQGFEFHGIDEHGTVYGSDLRNRWTPFRWSRESGFRPLASPGGTLFGAYDLGVNRVGQVVGLVTVDEQDQTVLWDPEGTPQVIQDSESGGEFLPVLGQTGVIGGSYQPSDGSPVQIAQWSPEEGLITIGDLWDDEFEFVESESESFVEAIGPEGQMIGYSTTVETVTRSFIYSPSIGLRRFDPDLGDTGYELGSILGFTDTGDIYAIGRSTTDDRRSVLRLTFNTPIPEPCVLPCMAFGGVMAWGWRRRRSVRTID